MTSLVVSVAFSYEDVCVQNSSLLLNVEEDEFNDMVKKGYFKEVIQEASRLISIGCFSGMSSLVYEIENAVIRYNKDEIAKMEKLIQDTIEEQCRRALDELRGK